MLQQAEIIVIDLLFFIVFVVKPSVDFLAATVKGLVEYFMQGRCNSQNVDHAVVLFNCRRYLRINLHFLPADLPTLRGSCNFATRRCFAVHVFLDERIRLIAVSLRNSITRVGVDLDLTTATLVLCGETFERKTVESLALADFPRTRRKIYHVGIVLEECPCGFAGLVDHLFLGCFDWSGKHAV